MPIYFQRPENALKRANEFIDVGEKQWALNALYDVIKSRKHRTWQKIHEPIMCKYLELCVDLKKSHVAKEGLFQYRNICQQVNIKSLEDVVRGYLQLAEQKTDAAREESQQAIEVDDLDQMQTPEGILLSAVSSEDTQDRTDRVVLTPWVKFLWESYRQCLELLRNNSRVERLYHDIAQHAFKFCLKYTRKTEFRKLCDNLRAHLGHIHKHQNQQTSVNLNNPESHAMHLETRLVQLDSAIQMELWQEAYKAIEDIYGLMNLSKKAPNPRLMANYYQKLSLVFWKSNNYLFHSAALFRLFHLSREQKKNITSDEVTKLAARVVLATLAIPMTPNRTEIDRLVETDENVIDKNHRLLSTLLGLANVPTRASLLKDMVRFGIIQCAPVQLQELYCWLEIDFHPLKLCTRVQQTIKFLYEWEEFPDLQQYIPSIQSITVVRLIREISQVYQTIKFSRVLELAPFIKSFDLEYLVVEIARRNDLQVRIDHKQQSFHFGSELNISLREEVIEGPYLQSMPSDQLRRHLVARQNALSSAAAIIEPNKVKAETKDLRKDILKAYNLNSSKDHLRILSRQQIIEERKELLENLNYQKEVEERKLIEDKQQKLRDAEKERMARETEERNKQRLLKEQTEMKRKVVMEKIEQLKKTDIGSRIFEGMDEDELQNLDPDDLLNKQVEQIDREKKELQMKLRNQERKIDHLERAKRQEEIPLLLAQYEEVRKVDMEFWEEYERERIKFIYDEREIAIRERKRLLRIKEDKDKFLNRLQEARSSVYEEKMAEFSKLVEEERKKRFAERKQQRREERRETWYREQEEKRLRLIEEQQKREREEELAKLEEIEAQKRAKLEEIEAKKRAKEKEIEERLKREQEAANEKKRDEDKKFSKEKGKDSESSQKMTSWREREQEKKQSWIPQEKSDQDREADRDDKSRDWRKRDESRRSEDKDTNDGWRRRDKTSEEDRSDRSWKKDDSRSSYASSQRSFSGWRDRDQDRPKREVENAGSRRFEDRESSYNSSREQNRESDFPQKSSSGWRERDQEKRSSWAPRDRTERDPESNNEDKSRDWRRRDEPRKTDDREPPRNDAWKRRDPEPRKLDDRERERDMPRNDAWRRRDNQDTRKDERDFPKSDAWKTRDNPETRKDERNFPRSDAWKTRDSQETRKEDRDFPRSAWRSTESSKEGGGWRKDDNRSQLSSAFNKTK